jgi:hypothetical protein
MYGPSVSIPLLPDHVPLHPPDHNEGQFSSTADLQRIHSTWEERKSMIMSKWTLNDVVYS